MPAPTAPPIPHLHAFIGHDVPWLLQERVESHGDRPYLTWAPFEGEGRTWTYAQFGAAVERFAAGLSQRGVGAGEFVLIHLGNCPEFLVAWHACSRVGAVAVTTNTRSSLDELSYYASNCGAIAAVTQPALVDLVAASSSALRWIAATETDLGAAPAAYDTKGVIPFAAIAGDPATIPARPRDPLAFNSVQYTSGTTARPKGVVWTHANVLWGARLTASLLKLTDRDIALVHFPLFHTNSLMYATLGSLWGGGSIVVMPRFSASRFWDTAIRNECTWVATSMFVLKALAKHPIPDEHCFRFWGTATSDVPASKPFGVKALGWWGMTETLTFPIIAHLTLPNRPLAMGQPAAGYEIAVLRDDGTPVDFGETGNLLVRGIPGLSLFYEYLNNPEATARAFDESGWMRTGDKVTPFDDGHIRFEGRGGDMLRVGGENVAAAEIERVILGVPGVSEVAVVAKPHEMLGEVPAAFVIPAGDPATLEDRVLSACRAELADFKVPTDVIFVDQMPRSTLNKVSKKDLRLRLSKGEDE